MTQTITTHESKGRDDYGRTGYMHYATRPGAGYGQVAVITVLPKIAAEADGARHMVTDRRSEMPYTRTFREDRTTVVKGLAAARAEVARIANLPVGEPAF